MGKVKGYGVAGGAEGAIATSARCMETDAIAKPPTAKTITTDKRERHNTKRERRRR